MPPPPLNLQHESKGPKAGVSVLLPCSYNSMVMLGKQSLNYVRTEGSFVHRPPDTSEIKAEGALPTLIFVILRAAFLTVKVDFVAAMAGCNFQLHRGRWLVHVSLCQTARILLKITRSTEQLCQRVRCSMGAVNKPSVYSTKLRKNIYYNETFCSCWLAGIVTETFVSHCIVKLP